jgi:hypothetical protein
LNSKGKSNQASFNLPFRDRLKHQRKLDEIHNRGGMLNKRSTMGNQQSVHRLTTAEEELRRHEEKVRRNKEFLQNEKNLEINRSNQALLNKLVEISAGKWSCIPTKEHMTRDFRSVDPAVRFSMTSTFKNSLNLPYRKKETDRIERENHAFAKRLFERTSNLSKKKLEDEYREHQRYLK